MNCRNARKLLDRGISPGSSNALRATLGFHLSGCAACRMYRRDMEDLRVLRALLAQPLCAPRARASAARRRPTSRALRMAGAALLVGGALAVLPTAGMLSTAVTEARPAVTKPSGVLPAPARAKQARATERENMALLQSLLEEKLTLRQARTTYAGELRIARAELAPGLEIRIPVMPVASNNAAPQQQATTYTVVPGDSLWLIAEKIWGDGRFWDLIYTANKTTITDPRLIYPNQKLTIPFNLAIPSPTVPASSTTVPTATATVPASTPIPAGNYTIARGDTLSQIALRRLGDADRWREIYTRNQAVIGANPSMIFPGTVLNLP